MTTMLRVAMDSILSHERKGNAYMTYSYYPGCTLKTKAKDLDRYGRLSAEALGVTLEEIENWQCCGAVYPQASDEIATKLSAIADFDSVLSLGLIEKANAKREELKKQAAVASGAFTILAEDGAPDPAVEAKILERRDAKKAKNFSLADAIRDELKASGIELTDIPGGVRWKRV